MCGASVASHPLGPRSNTSGNPALSTHHSGPALTRRSHRLRVEVAGKKPCTKSGSTTSRPNGAQRCRFNEELRIAPGQGGPLSVLLATP